MIIQGIPVEPLSSAAIELLSLEYLVSYYPQNVKSPSELDVEHMLSVSLFSSHGYKLEIEDDFQNPKIEGQTIIAERVIRLPQKCYDGILLGDGRARFTGCHEVSHVLLHSEQLEILQRNPARLMPKELKTYEDPDWQAEHSAGALLMPLTTAFPTYRRLLSQQLTVTEIAIEFCDIFGVSVSAATARIRKFRQPSLEELARKIGLTKGGSQ